MIFHRTLLLLLLPMLAMADDSTTEQAELKEVHFDIDMLGNGSLSYEEIELRTFCKNTISQCHAHGGVCMTSTHMKSEDSRSQCTSTKTFPHTNCQTCHCCIGMKCPMTKACHACGGKCDSKCSSFQRPYSNLCGYQKCQCCLGACATSYACKAKGGRCIDQRSVCGGSLSSGCEGYNCQCCVTPQPPHQVLPQPLPQPQGCPANSKCETRGGHCTTADKCRSGNYLHRFCGGRDDCGCCLPKSPPATCETTTKKCQRKDGICCHEDRCKKGTFVKRYCGKAKDCGCCITDPHPETCETTGKCSRQGGVCCDEASCKSGTFVKRYCGKAEDCGCCIKDTCTEKSTCVKAHGHCKKKCGHGEVEIHHGCTGHGCKCCATNNCKKSLDCAVKGGVCCSKEACSYGKYYDKMCGNGCGCCVH